MEKFTNDLPLVDWNPILNSKYSNEAFDLFYNDFYKSFKTNFPLKKALFNKKGEVSPYITLVFKTSIKEKIDYKNLQKKWPITYGDTYG